jgi:hypothetical protein
VLSIGDSIQMICPGLGVRTAEVLSSHTHRPAAPTESLVECAKDAAEPSGDPVATTLGVDDISACVPTRDAEWLRKPVSPYGAIVPIPPVRGTSYCSDQIVRVESSESTPSGTSGIAPDTG